jgi:hypothetical protein
MSSPTGLDADPIAGCNSPEPWNVTRVESAEIDMFSGDAALLRGGMTRSVALQRSTLLPTTLNR